MFSNPQENISILGLSDGMKVVDLGAGSGFYTIESAKRVGNIGRVYAVDIDRNILDRIKNLAGLSGLHNIEVIWGNAEKIGGTKLKESIADRVILSNILFQVEKRDMDNLVLEVKRIMKKDAKLLVIDWSNKSPIGPKTPVPELFSIGLFEKAGFVMEKTFDAGDHHYGIIFKKI